MLSIVFSRGWVVFWAVLAALSTLACSAPRLGRPAWVIGRQHRDYMAQNYMIGVGQGATTEAAYRAARTDLLSRFKDKLEAEFKIRAPMLSVGGVSWLRPEAVAELSKEPAGLEIPVQWASKDGKRHAALAVIPRAELTNALSEQIEADETQCQQMAQQAGRDLGSRPYSAVLNLLAALQLRCGAEEQRALLAAVSGPQSVLPARGPSPADLLTMIDQLLSSIHLNAAHGNGLSVRSDAHDVPLVLSVDMAGGQQMLLTGLPVRFKVAGGSNQEDLLARVDAAGMAQANLGSVSAHAGHKFTVKAQVAGDLMVQEAGVDPKDVRFAQIVQRASARAVEYMLNVVDSQAGRVALVIAETREGEFHENSKTVADLVRDLTRAGFFVVELEELEVELPQNPSPKTMAAAMTGKADYLIYGVTQARVSKTLAAGMSFAEAQGELIAVKVSDGTVLGKAQQKSKGPGRDPKSAMTRALSSLSRKALKTLLPALRSGDTSKP